MNREPGVRLINPYGINVTVSISRVRELLSQGFKKHTPGLTVKNANDKSMIIFRPAGGLGDMISILPSIEQLCSRSEFDITIAFPSRYHYLFSHLPIKLIGYETVTNVQEFVDKFGYQVDLWCPAGDYEGSVNYKVDKNRIENFAESFHGLEIMPNAPSLGHITSIHAKDLKKHFKRKKIIGFQIVSANKSKDWPYFEELAEILIKSGFGVVCFDEMYAMETKGVLNIIRTSQDRILSMIQGLDCLIAPDSGLMWAALAQGIKTIALFGPTNGELTLKYFDPNLYRIIQKLNYEKCHRPCYYARVNNWFCYNEDGPKNGECMSEISVENVLITLEEFINARARKTRARKKCTV